jgi:putative endonuclease
MYYIYVLYNRSYDKIYIGQTVDLEKRPQEHNEKIHKGYTSRYNGTWEIVYKEEVPTRSGALIREKQLKSFRGREFIKKHISDTHI